MRYNRQIMLPEIGNEGQAKLKAAKVLIVGVGGLGSPIALYLTGAGVGTIGLVDFKAVCAAMHLTALNSEITVNSCPGRLNKDNASELISDYDIVVDGCDNFATRYLINDICIEQGKPYVYGAICGFEGQVSVFNYGNTPKTYRDLYPDEEEMLRMPPPPKGVLGVTPAITGSVEATEVLKIICGFGEVLAGKLWTIDLRTWQSNIFSL